MTVNYTDEDRRMAGQKIDWSPFNRYRTKPFDYTDPYEGVRNAHKLIGLDYPYAEPVRYSYLKHVLERLDEYEKGQGTDGASN